MLKAHHHHKLGRIVANYFPERTSDGTWHSSSIDEVLPKFRQQWGYSFLRARTLAVPLSTITDSEALAARVVRPLLDDLKAPRATAR